MKVAIIGDMHLGTRSGDQNFLDYQIGWLENVLLPHCKRNGITTLIQTGDFFDVRQHMKLNVMDFIIHRFKPLLVQYGIQNWITYGGNHDMYYRDSNEICSLDILTLLSDATITFTVVKDEAKFISLGKKVGVFVPWMNKNNQERLIKESEFRTAEYVFGHFDMVGFPMYKGILSTHGLDADRFKNKRLVVSGHYHTISQHKNIQYVGTPYHLTWMDWQDGTHRGFWVLDTDTDVMELIENEEFMTMFAVIEYDPNFDYKDGSFDDYKGNIVKVLISEKPDEKHFKKYTMALAKAPFLDYKIIDTTQVIVEKVVVSEKALKMDTTSAIDDYIEKQEGTFNKDNVKALARSVYIEAMEKFG